MGANEKLLACFEEAPGAYVSGERLSRELGVSRTAVWKRIRRLEEEGYVFESVPRLGYKLVRGPDKYRMDELMKRFSGTAFGKSVKLYDVVESTQNAAHEALLAGAPEGALVLAEGQSAGRGRFGRVWFSPPGKGIYVSFLLKPNVPLAVAPQMTLLISVALCRAIRKETGANATIKWPNDILIDGRKVCGILVETMLEADVVKAMIAGVGITANVRRDELPEELRDRVTSLLEATGAPVSREAIVGSFFEQLEWLYDAYRKEGFGPVRTLWEALTSTLHGRVRVATPQGVSEGVAEGITEEGALLVRDDEGRVHTMYSGDLTAPISR
ncbi:biotin--[acetyl-CoA-carboxylase] ligase [Paenibacillus antri]|uniref:Bifunctional ligase/repressor BirA n=1 Tax=Paenibacillus antri TaxID=2582848 RepID=A0A5R9G9L2_9BACL|nr:biotin--[acetyl-CoA-carboxylase] ligase [Paenibacillus antri]TLS53122.1 biotin--[acetyl-CoA-carboxylase] ligase [Paenibacillus antri]